MGKDFDGVAIVPGVSLNRRLYTREAIGRAVARAQDRIRAGLAPLTMLTHHGAEDDSTRIVGRVTELWQDDDGAARFRAVFADTDEARTIEQLVLPGDDAPPFLRGVSIRGYFLGEMRRVLAPDGAPADTADDLELDGVDFTKTPGVVLAGVSTDETAQGGRTMIRESVAPVAGGTSTAPTASVTEQAGPARYADLGYLGERRWPLDTPGQAVAAWRGVGEAAGYTAPQRKRLRERTRKALDGHGLQIAEDGRTVVLPATDRAAGVAEGYAWGWEYDGSFSARLSNGPIDICVSSWMVDPAALDKVAMAAMQAAVATLVALDPDAIDGDTAETADREPATETTPADAGVTEAAPAAAATEQDEESAVGDAQPAAQAASTTQTPAAEALTTAHLPALAEAIGSAVAAAMRPAAAQEQAPAGQAQAPATGTPAAESGPLTMEGVRALLAEERDAMRQELIGTYGPRRRGFAGGTTTTTEAAGKPAGQDGPAKAPHDMTEEEWRAYQADVVGQVLPG
jgi:hypothetical protein